LQAGRDVDPVAEDVAVVDDDVAHVEPHPEYDLALLGHLRVDLAHRPLDRKRAHGPLDGARELGQNAVAHVLHDATAVPLHRRVDLRAAERPQARMGAGLVPRHEPGITYDVDRKDCGQAAFGSRAARHFSPRTEPYSQ
jgi:hypothetical protein